MTKILVVFGLMQLIKAGNHILIANIVQLRNKISVNIVSK